MSNIELHELVTKLHLDMCETCLYIRNISIHMVIRNAYMRERHNFLLAHVCLFTGEARGMLLDDTKKSITLAWKSSKNCIPRIAAGNGGEGGGTKRTWKKI